jgi:hypothetical protein
MKIRKPHSKSIYDIIEENKDILEAEFEVNGLKGAITELVEIIKNEITKMPIYIPNLGTLKLKTKKVFIPGRFINKPKITYTPYIKFDLTPTVKIEFKNIIKKGGSNE